MDPIEKIKTIVTGIILAIIAKCDDARRADAERIAALTAALEAEKTAREQGEAAAAAKFAADAEQLGKELQEQFNPTPAADALIAEVVANPAVDTTTVEAMPGFEAVGTSEPTPVEVKEAAVETLVSSW
jgi:hypothetical protein